MGESLGTPVGNELRYLLPGEFERVRNANAPRNEIGALYADMARLNALYMIARAGSGHIGTSFSVVDILTHLHLEVLGPDDICFSSKGHDAPALYAILIAKGGLPPENLHSFRMLGGLPGHPDIAVPGMVANTGSLGMGISKAKGMIFAARRQGLSRHVFVITGDGELQEGQNWEALLSTEDRPFGELTIIVDSNKFQSDYAVEQTSTLGDIAAKFAAFGCAVTRIDGHDHQALSAALTSQCRPDGRPSVIIADTVKGKGVSFMEATTTPPGERYKYHSGAPSEEDCRAGLHELGQRIAAGAAAIGLSEIEAEADARPSRPTPTADPVRLFPAYSAALLDAAERDPNIVALDADLALDMGLIPFVKRYPDRFVECGIAEQDMVSQAGGMALGGLLPVVHSFSCFLSTRPNEQIFNNATERTRCVYVGGLSGVLPAGPGHSHQSLREISAIGGIPGLVMVEPAIPEDVAPLFDWCLAYDGPSFLRLCSIPYPISVTPPSQKPVLGRGVTLREGRDGVIFAAGLVLVAEALEAADALAVEDGFELAVVNMPWLNRVDVDWLAEVAADVPLVVTLDNHFPYGGQGQMIRAALAGIPQRPRLLSLAVEDIPPSGGNAEVLAAVGLDAAGIAEAIRACEKRDYRSGRLRRDEDRCRRHCRHGACLPPQAAL